MIDIWPSPAKINLFLYVNGIQPSGYHNIQSLFQFINYSDELKIIPNKTGIIELFTENQDLLNIKNIIITAAELLKKKAKYYGKKNFDNLGAKIFLNKKIPLGSGLGGGSSNAATTLVVLNKLWNTKFTLQELARFSIKIGADIPAFIIGKTTIVQGIGDILKPIYRQEKWYLIIYPYIHISTKKMFNNLYLKNNTSIKSISLLLKSPFKNDFEYIVKKKFLTIAKLLAMLSKYAPSRITGTGSCIFSEFNDKESAKKVFSLIPKNMKKFITKGINISPLHHYLYKKKYKYY